MNGQEPSSTNGISISTQAQIAQNDLDRLLQALEAIYNPRSSNDLRKQATLFLDRIKTDPSAPASGFALATDRARPHIVRHYGLSLLDFAIKYRWVECDQSQRAALRTWAIQLAEHADEEDPPYIRNKIAQIWAEVAKRGWVPDWLNMDELLYRLFQRSFVHQEIVLHVLETLSEESFAKEDYNGILPAGGPPSKQGELGRACVEIFTSASVWSEAFPDRSTFLGVRHGDDGWLHRLSTALQWCLDQDVEKDKDAKNLAVKIFSVLRSALNWVIPKAIRTTPCVNLCAQYLSKSDVALRTVSPCYLCPSLSGAADRSLQGATESFHALYHRQPASFSDEDLQDIVCPLLSTDGIQLLEHVYTSSCADLPDLDEAQYSMLKKQTEVLVPSLSPGAAADLPSSSVLWPVSWSKSRASSWPSPTRSSFCSFWPASSRTPRWSCRSPSSTSGPSCCCRRPSPASPSWPN